jgi:hypothetical protein
MGTSASSHDPQAAANSLLNATPAQSELFSSELKAAAETDSTPIRIKLTSEVAYDADQYRLSPSRKSTKINL